MPEKEVTDHLEKINQTERKGWPSGFESIGQEKYREYQQIISTIQKVSNLFGYEQLQTPRVVDLSWVTTKNVGEEIKNEMFGITRVGQTDPVSLVLVFEHTLSLAKYLAFQGQQIRYPFRRIEVDSVYRGERAQKGRKREFLQADVDVVGLEAPWGEVEIISIMSEMLDLLSFPPETKIHLNDRKILANLIRTIDGVTDPEVTKSIMRQIDKLDKESREKVISESISKNIPTEAISQIIAIADSLSGIDDPIQATESFSEILKSKNWLSSDIESSLKSMVETLNLLGKSKKRVCFDLCLARGLDYYTDIVFEIHDPRIGYSLCGGGRYDNLIEDMGGPANMAAIGFAFGVDRMVLAMEYLAINSLENEKKKIAILAFGDNNQAYALDVASRIRSMDIPAVTINPGNKKIKNLLKQASDAGYPYCIIVGDDEVRVRTVSLKNMETREQNSLPLDSLDETIEKIFKGRK